ncbi:sigma-54-dependent transcriptional regulator [Oleiphilus sp. HI0080]|uniref:sigma-54-dependent transcriptional regulator n=1 Tax=Oleiphilus sp. HI0080 TaxID=1822255 RepID=UPI000A961886
MAIQRILIIDDEPDIRELLQITLMRMGLDTRSAECLSDAEELLQTEDFSLCLTDMNLPDGNGIDFVRMMQTQFSDTPVAMITAYGSIETAIEALKAGAFDFISKPVDLAQLRNLVSSALRLQESSQVAIPNETEDQVILFGESPALKKLSTQVKSSAGVRLQST